MIKQSQFILSWGWVGLVTGPRILFQAAKLYFVRRLAIWHLPEPKKGTISRRANSTEETLEKLFCYYLRDLVENSAISMAVCYKPAGLYSSEKEIMRSTLGQRNPLNHIKTLEIQVLRPDFYSMLAHSRVSDCTAVGRLLEESNLVHVSRMDLLCALFGHEQPRSSRNIRASSRVKLMFHITASMRPFPKSSLLTNENVASLSELDYFILSKCDPRQQVCYYIAMLKVVLIKRLAFGHVEIFYIELLLIPCFCFSILLRFIGIL
jgi:hypothetical protein